MFHCSPLRHEDEAHGARDSSRVFCAHHRPGRAILPPPAKLESLSAREAFRNAIELMQGPARFMGLMLPGVGIFREFDELNNKLEAFRLFEYADRELNLPDDPVWSLYSPVRLALAKETFRAIWILEGVAHHYGTSGARRLENTLSAGVGLDLPLRTMISLHAGLGMAFASRALGALGSNPNPASIRDAVARFIDMCRINCRPGWDDASIEPIGVVARTMYPGLLNQIGDAMASLGTPLQRLYWHGVGRALYFVPSNFMPFAASHSRALESALSEPQSGEDRLNAVAGLTWAVTMVNLPQPAVVREMMTVCAQRGVRPAFLNGLVSALLAWRSMAPDDEKYLRPYLEPMRGSGDAALWNEMVVAPVSEALRGIYPGLEANHNLAGVYTYRTMGELQSLAYKSNQESS